jgi:hypothetical protein
VLGSAQLAGVLDGHDRVAALRNFQVSALALTVPVNRSISMDQLRARIGLRGGNRG